MNNKFFCKSVIYVTMLNNNSLIYISFLIRYFSSSKQSLNMFYLIWVILFITISWFIMLHYNSLNFQIILRCSGGSKDLFLFSFIIFGKQHSKNLFHIDFFSIFFYLTVYILVSLDIFYVYPNSLCRISCSQNILTYITFL